MFKKNKPRIKPKMIKKKQVIRSRKKLILTEKERKLRSEKQQALEIKQLIWRQKKERI